jgi:hypothetical protein
MKWTSIAAILLISGCSERYVAFRATGSDLLPAKYVSNFHKGKTKGNLRVAVEDILWFPSDRRAWVKFCFQSETGTLFHLELNRVSLEVTSTGDRAESPMLGRISSNGELKSLEMRFKLELTDEKAGLRLILPFEGPAGEEAVSFEFEP